MMRAWNKLMHQAGGRDEMDPSMWGMDMDLDPEEAMAVMESMQGEMGGDKLVDNDFFNKFEDDFDDDDLD